MECTQDTISIATLTREALKYNHILFLCIGLDCNMETMTSRSFGDTVVCAGIKTVIGLDARLYMDVIAWRLSRNTT